MTIKETQESIIQEFESFKDWDEKYAYIIKIGKELDTFPEDQRTEENKLSGCQSQVWLHASVEGSNVLFKADSDAMIVKGLIALLIKVYSNHSPDEILSSPPEFIKKIGIDNHLSLTRKNGLSAMLKQIQRYAIAYKALFEMQKINHD
ncbi:MAG: SufE family protein [bacterium]